MIRATKVERAGAECADWIALDYAERHLRRKRLVSAGGRVFLADLPHTVRLAAGDALTLENGEQIEVRAEPEPVLVVTAADPRELARLAWHIGNRHTPCRIGDGELALSADPVLAEMLRGLGAEVREAMQPFEPEAGAYAGHSHARAHSHRQDPE